jgi:hypothetical protein
LSAAAELNKILGEEYSYDLLRGLFQTFSVSGTHAAFSAVAGSKATIGVPEVLKLLYRQARRIIFQLQVTVMP